MPKVSIIILSYNSAHYIPHLIESILDFNKKSDYEIIVVDNDSSDETIKIIQNLRLKTKGLSSKLRIVKNANNVGFAKGINQGAKEAKGEYLLFINPDTLWKSGTIDDMVQVFENDIGIGVVGGKMVNQKGEAEKSAGKFLKVSQVALTAAGLDEKFGVRFAPNNKSKVDFVSGGFMMVKADLFRKVGGFDENLFMYVEDMELCFRIKMAGYLTYFTPGTIIEHAAHGSSNRSFAIKSIYKGIFYFHKKHGTPFSYFIVKSLLLGKAHALVIIGKMVNNKYLVDTYRELVNS